MLTLNTVHLSEKTLDLLAYEATWEDAGAHKEKKFPLIKVYCVGHHNIGGVTYIIDTDRNKLKKTLEENNNLPEDLRMILIEAFDKWCDTIRLKDDGPTYANLPMYDCD
jgi:hypothetical protein